MATRCRIGGEPGEHNNATLILVYPVVGQSYRGDTEVLVVPDGEEIAFMYRLKDISFPNLGEKIK